MSHHIHNHTLACRCCKQSFCKCVLPLPSCFSLSGFMLMSLYHTSHWVTDAAWGKPRLFSPNIWPCHWSYSLCVQASCNLASSPIVLWCHSPSVSDTTIPPPVVFSGSPSSSSVNLQYASLTLDHPPIYQSLVFNLLPFSFFLSSYLPLLQYISILHLIPFHYSFLLHHNFSLSFPFFFFFFFISVTAVSTSFEMWDSYSHILFSSPRRQQCHTTAAENRGQTGTGGWRACDQRFAGSNLCEKCSRTNFQSFQCFIVLQWSQRGRATARLGRQAPNFSSEERKSWRLSLNN